MKKTLLIAISGLLLGGTVQASETQYKIGIGMKTISDNENNISLSATPIKFSIENKNKSIYEFEIASYSKNGASMSLIDFDAFAKHKFSKNWLALYGGSVGLGKFEVGGLSGSQLKVMGGGGIEYQPYMNIRMNAIMKLGIGSVAYSGAYSGYNISTSESLVASQIGFNLYYKPIKNLELRLEVGGFSEKTKSQYQAKGYGYSTLSASYVF